MTSMNDNKDDIAINSFMAAYMAPAADDGFTQAVMQKAQALNGFIEPEMSAAERRLRRVVVYGACFIGGIIAAAQLPKLISLTSSMVNRVTITDSAQASSLGLSSLDMSNFDVAGIMNGLPTTPLWLASLVVLGAMIWVMIDEGAGQTL